jgi:hypothetical protein
MMSGATNPATKVSTCERIASKRSFSVMVVPELPQLFDSIHGSFFKVNHFPAQQITFCAGNDKNGLYVIFSSASLMGINFES